MYVCLRNGGKCSDYGSQPLFFLPTVEKIKVFVLRQNIQ